MKQKFTILAALLFSTIYGNAQINYEFENGDGYGNGTKNMVGQREYRWNVNTAKWENKDSFNLKYDAKNKMTVRNYLVYDTAFPAKWVNKQITKLEYDKAGFPLLQVDTAPKPTTGYRYEYTFNSKNQEILKHDKLWNAGTWSNYRRHTTTYTAFDKVNVELTEGWHFVNKVWQNSERGIHVYNAKNLDSILTYEKWNSTNSKWDGSGRYFYTYNANNLVSSTRSENYDLAFAVYKPSWKNDYTYDAYSRLSTTIESEWNVNVNVWRNLWKRTYSYNSKGLLEKELTEKWNQGNLQWDLWNITTYTYDAANQPIEEMYQNWTNSAWKNSGKQTYTRDASGYRTRFLVQFWNENTLAWQNFAAFDFHYSTKNTSGIQQQTKSNFMVYPNPVNGSVVFVNSESETPYTIYNMEGKKVTAGELQKGTNSIIFNEDTGVYFLRAGNNTSKFVKQ